MKKVYSDLEVNYLKDNFMLSTVELVEGLTLISGDVKTCKSVNTKLYRLDLVNERARIKIIKREERKKACKPNPPRKKPALKKTRIAKPVLKNTIAVKGMELTDALAMQDVP